jgi:hypothetical protein
MRVAGRAAWSVGCCAVLAACGHQVAFTPLAVPPRPLQPRPESSVELFTASKPTRPYVVVGELGSRHDGAFSTSTDDEVLLALRTAAAEVGCDAVVLTSEADHTNLLVYGNKGSTKTTKTFGAVCAVYTDAPAPAAAAPAAPAEPAEPAPAASGVSSAAAPTTTSPSEPAR